MKASDFQLKSQTSASPVRPAFFDRNSEAAFFSQQPQQAEPFFNPAVQSSVPIQAKLTVGAAGDQYEQEADRVAQAVVQRMNQPEQGQLDASQKTLTPSDQPLQRETLPEDDELQMKPDSLQRETDPEEEDELQMKPDSLQRETDPEEEDELQMKPLLQRQGGGAFAASNELETRIQQSRGGGQPLTDSIRAPMEQAFGGVDFSGVKVHTDTQSDQLNRSIQAKAFTTGQDVFFQQGAYQPGSQRGQELLAHELTHVVQQNDGLAQRIQPKINRKLLKIDTTQNNWVQRLDDDDLEEINKNKDQKKKLQEIKNNYNKTLGFGGSLYNFAEENFDFYFGEATSLDNLEKLVNNAIKKAEDKKTKAEAESASIPLIVSGVGTNPQQAQSVSSSTQGNNNNEPKVNKIKKTKVNVTDQFFASASKTKQQEQYKPVEATNPLIQSWINKKPLGAVINGNGFEIKADTVYIYATVTIRDLNETAYVQYNVYSIETHYHPVPTSKNYLHVKKSKGSDPGNVVNPDNWLIPGGRKTLNQAVTEWNKTKEDQSEHNW